MPSDLQDVLADAARPPRSGLDFDAIRARARRRRVQRVLTAVVIVPLVAVAGKGVISLLPERASHVGQAPDVAAGSQAEKRDANKKAVAAAATFAIRSVAAVGLHEPFGDYYDYVGIIPTQTGWRATFHPADCSETLTQKAWKGCRRIPGRAVLYIERRNKVLTIVRTSGHFSDAKSDRLRGRSAPARYEGPRVIHDVEILDWDPQGPGSNGIFASYYYTGTIPSDAEADCRVVGFDASGNMTYKSDPSNYASDAVEAARDGMFSSGIPKDANAARVEVRCSEWKTVKHPASS